MTKQASRLAANALLDSPAERLNENSRNDRARFENREQRFLFGDFRKINARFEAGQHDNRAAARRVSGLFHVLRSFIDRGVEVVLLALMLAFYGHDVVGNGFAIASERLHKSYLV